MLTYKQKKYIKNRETCSLTDEVKRQYDYRIREKAKQMLKDLTVMAKYLSEDQMAQIFTAENMKPLIRNILNAKKTYVDNKKYGSEQILNSRTFLLSKLLAFYGIDTAYFNVHLRLRTIAHQGYAKPEDKVAFLVRMSEWEDKDIKPFELDLDETYPFLKDSKHLDGD